MPDRCRSRAQQPSATHASPTGTFATTTFFQVAPRSRETIAWCQTEPVTAFEPAYSTLLSAKTMVPSPSTRPS